MQEKKLILVLKTLSEDELKEFENYLKNNHGRKKEALKVFKFIKNFHPNFKDEQLISTNAFPKIFGKTISYNAKKLKDLLSILYLALEDFLVVEELKIKPHEKQLMLAKIYRKRQVDKLFFGKVKNTHKGLDKTSSNTKTFRWYLKKMELNNEVYFHPQTPKNKIGVLSLTEAMQNLDLFFEGMKLIFATEMANRENIFKDEYEVKYLGEIKKEVSKKEISYALHKAYGLAFQMLKMNDDDSFAKLKEIFEKERGLIDFRNQQVLLTYLINFAAIKIKKGENQYLTQVFELNLIGLESGVFIENGYLTDSRFLNIINIACALKKEDWTEWIKNFINDWQEYLLAETHENAINVGLSLLYFEQGDFEKVLKQLGDAKVINVFYELRIRTLKLCSLFELEADKMNLILDHCKAFENFVKRNKSLGEANQIGTLNLIKYLRKILRGKIPKDILSKNIKDTQPLFFKLWLLRKVNQ